MKEHEIIKHLFSMQDIAYKGFQKKLIPTTLKEMIGVRTPLLKKFAKEICKDSDIDLFLTELPHEYFDLDQLHAFIISLETDFGKCINEVEAFLPFIDNWATSDQLSPKVFKKHKTELLPYIYQWLESNSTYTVRFATGMLMQHFLDDDFDVKYIEYVVSIKSDEYYINMMRAWFLATSLAKQYEQTITYFENQIIDKWTHNKAIQKSVESYRITNEQKEYLKSLRLK
mgnify:CR=1 FL=1